MFLEFKDVFGIVRVPYAQPYEDPIEVRTGNVVVPDHERRTDLIGWVWCAGTDGRAGWTPAAWIEQGDPWTMKRDFSALELTVAVGDRLRLIHSESGFLWAETEDGRTGWVPDAMVELESAATVRPLS